MLSRCQLASSVSKVACASLHDVRLASTTIIRRSCASSSSLHTSSARRRPLDAQKPPPQADASSSSSSLFSTADTSWLSMLEELDGRDVKKGNARPKVAPVSRPRQSMTERESKVLTDMLDMIFTPPNDRRDASEAPAAPAPAPPQDEVGPTQVNDLFGRLRRLATRRPTQKALAATAELFDMKKEQMNACTSDQELLAWAAREVFDESVKYEAAAKHASANGAQKKVLPPLPPLQSPAYPQMIAYLMRTFREHYRDPNLALYIFKYAQKLSTVSYTFGCSTDAYNELIETRWTAFKDLKGVLSALKEMDVNAVPSNNRTQQLVEHIRQDIGYDIHAEQDPSSKLLMEIEEVLAIIAGGRKTEYTGLGAWKKSQDMNSDEGFDDWSKLDLLDFNPNIEQLKLRGRKRLQ